MDVFKEAFFIVGRVITILPLLLAVTHFMGKRSIGELPIFDYLVVITLGSVVGADIAEPKVDHLHTAIAVVAIGILQKAVTLLKVKSRKVGNWLTFEPTIVIYNGEFLGHNLKKVRYSIDNVLQMLRENQVFHLEDVHIAVIEANGKLSIKLKPGKETVTINDMNLPPTIKGVDIPIVLDGKVEMKALERLNLDEEALMRLLKTKGIDHLSDVFYAAVTENNEITVSLRNGRHFGKEPPLYH